MMLILPALLLLSASFAREACWKSPAGSRQLEVASWKSPAGSRQLEVASWKSPAGSRLLEVACWKSPAGSRLENLRFSRLCPLLLDLARLPRAGEGLW